MRKNAKRLCSLIVPMIILLIFTSCSNSKKMVDMAESIAV